MVLSNYKCMLPESCYSIVSSNRNPRNSINSTSRNRLLLQVIHFRKCSIRSSDITVFTETSRTAILHEEVLQDSSAPIPAPMLHVHITLQSREFSIQNPILHTEDKELFEYYYYIPEGKETFTPKKKILRIEGKEIF